MEYFIGISLSTTSTVETGLAVIDSNSRIILVDKLFSVKDVQFFFDNYSSLKQSHICVSLPWDNNMLNGKWRVHSKPYQLVNSKYDMPNLNNWTQRFSTRGCEYFKSLNDGGIDISRFELFLTRQELNLGSYSKERTPADCKFLQNALKIEHKFEEIPGNMMPMSQLEAIVGAIVAREKVQNPDKIKKLFEFGGLDVININNHC